MSSPDLANDLLALAREDLEAARSLQQGGRVSERPVGFHAQQAVEKALKAVLAAKGVQFPFSHDIALLVELCRERGCEIPEDFEGVDRLSPYAATVRYGLGDPGTVDPADGLRWASSAIEWAEAQGATAAPPAAREDHK